MVPEPGAPEDRGGAAETFVFLSGFAAAIAYGRSFRQAGIALGSIAVLFHCVQVYVAHLALFLLIAALIASLTSSGAIDAGWEFRSLDYFFEHTPDALLAVISLRYVPNFIDILLMYLVILLWLPLVWGLARVH